MMMMKISGLFVIVMCLYVAHVQSISDEMKDLIAILHKTCVDESGADDALIEKAQKGDFVDDGKLKCYMKCIMDQMATMDEDGMIDTELVLSILPDELKTETTIKGITSCGTKVGIDHCDNAFLTNKCWYDASPKEYFLV